MADHFFTLMILANVWFASAVENAFAKWMFGVTWLGLAIVTKLAA